MNNSNSEIEILKAEVEKVVGRPLKSPIDFDFLSYKVREKINEPISSTTIKRLWGYIVTMHKPRYSTLSTLSRFVGSADWDSYCFAINSNHSRNSNESGKEIYSIDLSINDIIELTWGPDKYCIIKYLGEKTFKVLKAENANISIGDTFKTFNFNQKHPLSVTELHQEQGTINGHTQVSEEVLLDVTLIKD